MLSTATASRLTIVELTCKAINVEDSIEAGFVLRDVENVELYSDSPLDYQAIKAKANRPGWTITGITEIDLDTAPQEF